jgi:membrane protease YdiL (CAAX protease family)
VSEVPGDGADDAARGADRGAAPEPAPAAVPAVQHWPPGMPSEGDAIAVSCPACAQPWRVHPSMAGFRLRCRCSGWVMVPAAAAAPVASKPTTLPAPRSRDEALPVVAGGLPTDERGLVSLSVEPGAVVFAPIATDLPLAPGALLQASDSNRTRWTTRTVLEFVAMMAALFVPQVAAMLLSEGREFVLLLPLADLVSGALLLVALAFAGPYARMGFGGAKARYWAEAVLMTAPFLLLAHLWMQFLQHAFPGADDPLDGLREQLGVAASLFVIAVSPAVLEEIIFRGALQGRLLALLGERTGLVVTAMAFAACHQAPSVLLVHASIGLYLGWLRQRCGSLLPGMLLHFLYNGSLVLLA